MGVACLCRLRYDDPGGDGAVGEGDVRTESMLLLCQSSRGFNAGVPSSFRMSSGVVVASRRLHGRVETCGPMLP